MARDRASALIVAKPGRQRDSLQAIVASIPKIGTVDKADDGPSARRMIAEHLPSLVLLDFNLPGDEAQTVLRQIQSQFPQTRCIVLADGGQRQRLIQSTGANGVLIKGFPTTELCATIERLLSGTKEDQL